MGKKLVSFASAVFMLVIFVPVLYNTIFVGNDVEYNAEHKIEALYANTTLLLFGVLAFLVFVGLYFFLDKIPYNRYTKIGTALFAFIICVIFCIVKMEISKCIAFYGGWDCGMVANSALWLTDGKDIGYDDYYYIYSNNIPIVWLLYTLCRLSGSIAGYAYNVEFIWIQFQCIMFALAVFFSTLTILVISRKIAPAVLCLIINVLWLGLCPWQIIPYTDPVSIAVPVMVLFLYALFRRIKHKSRYFIWFLLVVLGMLGGIMKATCYVALIASVAVEFIWLVFEEECIKTKMKKMGLCIILAVCGYTIALWCRSGMYQSVNYVPDHDLEMTWSNYFYNGLNEATTGACSGEGLAIVREYAGYPRKFRQGIELGYAKDRMAEKGIWGLMDFWLRKQVMNFNDGTFSWFQEGFFHAWDYEEITESRYKDALRSFFWIEGKNYKKFVTWSQGIWIFILMGLLAAAVSAAVFALKSERDTEKQCIYTAGIVIFIGIFFFVMLFEGRARYLLNYIPVFAVMAVLGYSELSKAAHDCLCGILAKRVFKNYM